MEHGAALYTAGIKPWDSLVLRECTLSAELHPQPIPDVYSVQAPQQPLHLLSHLWEVMRPVEPVVFLFLSECPGAGNLVMACLGSVPTRGPLTQKIW